PEEVVRASVIDAGQFVEACGARPAGVLEALCELSTVDVALDLDHNDVRVGIERDDVRPTTRSHDGLSCDTKERLARDRVEVVPKQLLKLVLVQLGTTA